MLLVHRPGRGHNAAARRRWPPGHPEAEAQGLPSAWHCQGCLHPQHLLSLRVCHDPASLHGAKRKAIAGPIRPLPANALPRLSARFTFFSAQRSDRNREHLYLQAEAMSELAAAVCGLQQFLVDAPQVLSVPCGSIAGPPCPCDTFRPSVGCLSRQSCTLPNSWRACC